MAERAQRRAALAALDQMLCLLPNWDSYGAACIDGRAIEKAKLMLDGLSGNWTPVPCSDGAVQLELHEGGFDIEINIRAVNGGCSDAS